MADEITFIERRRNVLTELEGVQRRLTVLEKRVGSLRFRSVLSKSKYYDGAKPMPRKKPVPLSPPARPPVETPKPIFLPDPEIPSGSPATVQGIKELFKL